MLLLMTMFVHVRTKDSKVAFADWDEKEESALISKVKEKYSDFEGDEIIIGEFGM